MRLKVSILLLLFASNVVSELSAQTTREATFVRWEKPQLHVKFNGNHYPVIVTPNKTVVGFNGPAQRTQLKRSLVIEFQAEAVADGWYLVDSPIAIVGRGTAEKNSLEQKVLNDGTKQILVRGMIISISRSGSFVVNTNVGKKRSKIRCRIGDRASFEFKNFPDLSLAKRGDRVVFDAKTPYVEPVLRVRGEFVEQVIHFDVYDAKNVTITAHRDDAEP